MAGKFVRLVVVCVSAVALAGCLSVNVDKTETKSSKAYAPADHAAQDVFAESAE